MLGSGKVGISLRCLSLWLHTPRNPHHHRSSSSATVARIVHRCAHAQRQRTSSSIAQTPRWTVTVMGFHVSGSGATDQCLTMRVWTPLSTPDKRILLRGFHRTAWIAFFLLTLLLQPRQGGSGCIRVFGFAVGIPRAIMESATRGQTFKRSRGSQLLSAYSRRGPTRLHELRLATSRDFNGIAVLRCCTDTVEMAGIRQHEARAG